MTTEVNYIKPAEFETEINCAMPVVIDFTASWCGPCRLVAPLIDRLAEDYQERARVFKFDIDQDRELVKQFGIRSIPAVLVFKDGAEVERIVGVKDYEVFTNAVNSHL
jgi:thioredoxin 1